MEHKQGHNALKAGMNFSMSLLEIKDVVVERVALVALRTSALVSWLYDKRERSSHGAKAKKTNIVLARTGMIKGMLLAT